MCNNCHPFFTGEQRIVDTAGQVERFMKRVSAKEKIAATLPTPEDKRAKKDKRGHPTPVPVEPKVESPAQLPLAVVEGEKPVEQVAPELPVIEKRAMEPVAELPAVKTQSDILPPARIETIPMVDEFAPAQVDEMQAAPMEEPVAEMKTARARTKKAKKPAAKKPAAKTAKPKVKAAAKPKASIKKSGKPKASAKKKK